MIHDLPEIALSVRQPWAHAIIHFDKRVENRAWSGNNPGLKFRGRVAIHAAGGMTREEYEEARDFIDSCGWTCPGASALFRGGIIGSVDVVGIARRPEDLPPGERWFFGPLGLILDNPKPCPFVPAKGALGFFRWQPGRLADVPKPAAWMLPKRPKLAATTRRMMPAPGLFDGEI